MTSLHRLQKFFGKPLQKMSVTKGSSIFSFSGAKKSISSYFDKAKKLPE
jgi:hypothetical protein